MGIPPRGYQYPPILSHCDVQGGALGVINLDADPLITDAVELKRLKMMIEFVDTPVVRKDGLGGIDKLRFDNTIDRVVAAFGIKSQVSPDGIFNSSFLPPVGQRKL